MTYVHLDKQQRVLFTALNLSNSVNHHLIPFEVKLTDAWVDDEAFG